MIKIFGLNINIADFFTQLGHGVTGFFGLLLGSGIVSVPTAQQATDVINGIATQVGVSGSLVHSAGWLLLVNALVQWILHNSEKQ